MKKLQKKNSNNIAMERKFPREQRGSRNDDAKKRTQHIRIDDDAR